MARQKERAGGSVPSAPSASKTRASRGGPQNISMFKVMKSPMLTTTWDPTMPSLSYGNPPTSIRDPLSLMPGGDTYQAFGAMAQQMRINSTGAGRQTGGGKRRR